MSTHFFYRIVKNMLAFCRKVIYALFQLRRLKQNFGGRHENRGVNDSPHGKRVDAMKIRREKKGITDDGVTETHPAFGMISLCRTTCSPPSVLFGSAVKHGSYISLTIKEASRETSSSHDWYFGKKELVRVCISGNQLGEMLSSMNIGDGVPCTIERFNSESRPRIEEFSTVQTEAQKQMEDQLDTVYQKSKDLLEKARVIIEKGAPKKADKEELLSLLTQLSHGIGGNVKYAGKCFDEKIGKMVTQAKGEVESFISSKIHSAGLEALAKQPLVEIEE